MSNANELSKLAEYHQLLQSIESGLYSIAENYIELSVPDFAQSIGTFRASLIPELDRVEKEAQAKASAWACR
jgi:hypothetical protein